jgi:hypothetical protein
LAARRTRDYYQALGYPAYRWALFAEVPFTAVAVPSGSWGGQRPNLADYVTLTGTRGRGERRRKAFMLSILILWVTGERISASGGWR